MADLYGSQARVIEVAIDRLYHSEAQEAREMQETRILYQYAADDAAMFGPDADLDGIDVVASYSAYEDAVQAALEAAYPAVSVSIRRGPHRVAINGLTDHNEVPAVEGIAHDVWESFGWVRRWGIVELYESNAGHLTACCGEVALTGFEQISGASFSEDAPLILARNTADWSVDRLDPDTGDFGTLIATYDGEVHITDGPIGVAGRIYLGLDPH